ncbi:MAG TPA: hypothetical protein VGQ65_21085 [Thermoanaerobaculia bacterium]|nr:hypothetical protein [Thermoanaerobaculia bacterium]
MRADLRRNVRRLLAKYGYPPDPSGGRYQTGIEASGAGHRECCSRW